MAEFPLLGEHCEVSCCNQLDFLPFVCSSCSGTFCKDHRSKGSHGCPSNEIDEVDKDRHLSEYDSEQKHQQCSFKACENRELLPVLCEHCHLNFCMRHRHQSDHKCSSLPEPQMRVDPYERVTRITGTDFSKVRKVRIGVKNDSRAAKVALMKLKTKAVGEKCVPQEERVYFNIHLPKGGKEKDKPMFFSKYWTVGKVVDKTASTAGLKNENNIASKKKLRLFHIQSGEIFEMGQSLQELLDSEDASISSGGDLILEYVSSDCNRIENTEEYNT